MNKPEAHGRGSKLDKFVGVVALVSLLVLILGLAFHSGPLVVGGFIGLFLTASWFGLAF